MSEKTAIIQPAAVAAQITADAPRVAETTAPETAPAQPPAAPAWTPEERAATRTASVSEPGGAENAENAGTAPESAPETAKPPPEVITPSGTRRSTARAGHRRAGHRAAVAWRHRLEGVPLSIHVGVFGPGLCGKTYGCKLLSRSHASQGRKSIVCDPNGEDWGAHALVFKRCDAAFLQAVWKHR
ncbi:MAG: type IV secretory system conjugative DNA transfer family protein, partial [Opitutaceae bacterium]|nr:type IV secretory system conjugative DNA transfer family protein [Opitutaceae bacterium]